MAVERVLFQTNVRTAISVGQASGLALAVARRAGVPVTHYSPNEVKLAVVGYGGAEKAQVQAMVQQLLATSPPPRPADAADALALAACHAWSAPLPHHVGRAHARRPGFDRAGRRGARPGGALMIGSVRGCVLERSPTGEVLVEVGGVGYRVLVPLGALAWPRPRCAGFLFTHLHVREDAMVLYGFPTRDERDTFEALIGATGVGPKLALAILFGALADGAAPRAARRRPRALTLVPMRREAHLRSGCSRAPSAARGSVRHRRGRDVDAPSGRADVREALTGLGYGPDEVRDVSARLLDDGAGRGPAARRAAAPPRLRATR